MTMPAVLALVMPVGLFIIFWALCYWPLAGIVSVIKGGAKTASAWLVHWRAGKRPILKTDPLDSYVPILLVIVVGGIAAIGAGYLLGELAEQIRTATSRVSGADHAIFTWFGNERQAAMTTLFVTATNIGGSIGLATISLVVVAILLALKERASAIFVVVSVAAGSLLNLGLKMIFARTRPDLTSALVVAGWYSFPSGHAMDSFITYGTLSYIALRQPWPWVAKSAALALALTTVVLVSVSRVYLGVHWASDIVGGWSAGTVWLVSAVVAFEMLLRLRQRRRGAVPSSPVVEVPDKPVPAQPRRA